MYVQQCVYMHVCKFMQVSHHTCHKMPGEYTMLLLMFHEIFQIKNKK